MITKKWLWIPGFRGSYKICVSDNPSKSGRVKSTARWVRSKANSKKWKKSKTLKVNKDKDGYLYVILSKAGKNLGEWKTYTRRIHRLVLEVTKGPRPTGKQARHLNDNKLDNTPNNLMWGTPKQNVRDALKNGVRNVPRKGSHHHWSIITEEDVLNIRREFRRGKSIRRLTKQFGLKYGHIWDIVNHKKWRHVA